jgi:hypothetical protein
MPAATSQSGKPITIGDYASISGTVTAVSGTGRAAVVTVLTPGGISLTTPLAGDMYTTQNA